MAYNILMVDDSQTTRSILKKMLLMAGIPIRETLQAENGQEALNILDNNHVDLMLVDINMPVMDGVELVNRMSADSLLQTVPVIVISTEGSKTRIAEMKTKGVLAYLRKPCTPEAIKSVVENILGDTNAERI